MGVKTLISLQEVQKLFPSYSFKTLTPTKDGVMDTTYVLDDFILKRYERDIKEKIKEDSELLVFLKDKQLNVPQLLAQNSTWFLYEKLKGTQVTHIQLIHIQALARFMSSMHKATHKRQIDRSFLEQYDIKSSLIFVKDKFYFHYKKLSSLHNYTHKNDGFIHGDIFADNTVFDKTKIGVFDFVDGGNGSFIFDIAVALLAFNPHKRQLYTRVFLNTYNQRAPFKIRLHELKSEMSNGAKLYSLLRIVTHKNTKMSKKLANFW